MRVRWLMSGCSTRRRNGGLTLLMTVAGSAPVSAQLAAPSWASAAAPLVFRGVTVIDVREGRLLPNQVVTLVGNRIQAIGPAGPARLAPGARVVEAQGKYLIPGLWDMHVHPNKGKDYLEWASWLFLANGVTGTRDAGSDVPLATFGQLKREIAAGTRIGPRLIVSGAHVNDTGCSLEKPYPISVCLKPGDVNRARHLVDSLKAAGADAIKSYETTPPTFFALAAEARRVGIPIDGHPSNIPPAVASDSGHRLMDHGRDLGGICGGNSLMAADKDATFDKCTALAARYRRNGTWSQLGPLADFFQRFPARLSDTEILDRLRYLPSAFLPDSLPRSVYHAPAPADLFTLVQRADLPIALGTDFSPRPREWWRKIQRPGSPAASIGAKATPMVPGFSLQDELLFATEHGLTPLRALQAATLFPAQALGLADSLGVVEAGKVADLILLDGDPLTDIYNIRQVRAVVANGRYYDRAALDSLLAQVEQLP